MIIYLCWIIVKIKISVLWRKKAYNLSLDLHDIYIKFLFGGVSSSSWCLRYAALFVILLWYSLCLPYNYFVLKEEFIDVKLAALFVSK